MIELFFQFYVNENRRVVEKRRFYYKQTNGWFSLGHAVSRICGLDRNVEENRKILALTLLPLSSNDFWKIHIFVKPSSSDDDDDDVPKIALRRLVYIYI